MKLVTFGGCALHTLAALIVSLTVARADWDLEQPAKWVQMPDLTDLGMDVRDWKSTTAGDSRTLADDWECRVTGNITNIHIWGSWHNDWWPLPHNVTFKLAIHDDLPGPPSQPGNILWQATFPPGTYQWREWQRNLWEGWCDPYPPPGAYQWPGDTACLQYNFPILHDWFEQQGTKQQPKVYWLEVQAIHETGYEFGWKTSPDHWNDAAVFYPAFAPHPGPAWLQLYYPPGHSLYGQGDTRVDLAFVIQGEEPTQETYDFGDAPDWLLGTGPGDYQTWLADNGAYHIIVPNAPFFDDGTFTDQPDAENDGQPDPNAWGDDLWGAAPDDEDGVMFPGILTAGQLGTVTIGVDDGWGGLGAGGAYVDAWIDFNADGDWTDLGEQIQSGWLWQGATPVGFFVPAGAAAGQTFARFRINSAGAGLAPTGGPAADGEVEDHQVWIEEPFQDSFDFGDAPDWLLGTGPGDYQTWLADNGACHMVVANAPYFDDGTQTDQPDPEADGQPDPVATGDDLAGANPDDEDGIMFPGILTAGQPGMVMIGVDDGWGGLGAGGAYVDAWIDFNADGDWTDLGEQIQSGWLPQGMNFAVFSIPYGAATGATFARFRINSVGALGPTGGPAIDGEVEDLAVAIMEPQEPPPDWKWVQQPDLSNLGMDVEAVRTYPYLLADDFLCTTNTAITNIVVWGSWYGDVLPEGDPNNVTFYLSFHKDIPAGVRAPWSMPGETLWWTNFPPGTFTATPVMKGELLEGWYNPATSNYTPNADYTCWRYDFPIDPSWAFAQTGTVENPIIYWLDVQAQPMPPSGGWFGWKTSVDHWNDDACWTRALEPVSTGFWWDMRYPPAHPYHPQSIDLAFALFGGPAEETEPKHDWGDAPDAPYPTRAVSGGASHLIVPTGPWLGGPFDAPDAEPDGQPDPLALGDDNDLVYPPPNDDENGAAFPTLIVGATPNVAVFVSNASILWGARVEMWIDWNGNGSWLDGGEYYPNTFLNGPNSIAVNVPLYAKRGTTFARLRISSFGVGMPAGPAADGEVEDYQIMIEERFDFGDAPDPLYPTLLASGGAFHVAVGPWLGDATDAPDIEPDGAPDPNALGDDNGGGDDEDGVLLPTLVVGLNAEIVYEVRGVSGTACVSGHIDWNADGDWDDAGETYAFWNAVSADGVYTNTITVPLGAARGTTFARVRVANGYYGPTGFAYEGEVEDYAVMIEERFDYGDAPLPYPTLAVSNGAVHIAVGPWFGDAADAPDVESDGQPDPSALGDDNAGRDDEDGVLFPTFIVGLDAAIVYEVRGVSGTAYISGHIDWNADGDWDDASETYAFYNAVSADGVYTNTLWYVGGSVPLDAARGTTCARVRVANGYCGPTGLAYDGEVEDYAITIEERFDWGDAPLPYPTLAVDNGAVHIVSGPSLGSIKAAPDWESDGQPDAGALGDDNAATDDENGVVFPATLVAGTTTNIDFVVANAPVGGAYVEIWIDWNGDGDWTTPGDYVWANWHADGWNAVSISVPTSLVWGDSFARVRISATGTGAPTGLVFSGEVEDYQVRLAGMDYGDAPESGTAYATTAANNGARHLLRGTLWMSPSVDAEPDGQPTAAADGDDLAGTDDEDGVTLPAFVRQDRSETVTVNVTATCKLNAWIDYNGDGDWLDAGEQVFGDEPLVAGSNALGFTVPLTAAIGSTYARFRVSGAGGDGPAGLADDGEVEDYMIEVREKFPPTLGPKWRQPLDCTYGLDLHSWTAPHPQGAASVGPVVADDWWCDGRPINAIRWWGSYIQYGGPSNELQVTRPYAFRLSWYLDRPTNTLGGAFSRPGPLLKQTTVTLQAYGTPVQDYDRVSEQYACTVPLDFLGPAFAGQSEHTFEYNVVLEEPWLEKNTLARTGYNPPCSSNVYWLAIEAMYDAPPQATANPWGWETTAQRFNWNDAAVIATNTLAGMTPWRDMTYVPKVDPWRAATRHPYLGRPVNMAFAMLSEVVGRRAVKWQQLPNMELGTDMPSWRYLDPLSPPVPWAGQALRADDFVSDGRRITDIHWWGSYIGWYEGLSDASEFNPAPLPQGVNRPLGFDLTWFQHVIGGPGTVLTNLFVPIERCHEMYYCTIPQLGQPTYAVEHEYQYYVDLLDEQLDAAPWYATSGGWYWLGVQAVFDNAFSPAPPGQAGIDYPHEGWGWKIGNIDPTHQKGWSQVTNYVPTTSWQVSRLPAWHQMNNVPHDLSFELTTDQTDTNATIAITSIQRFTNDVARVTSTGTGWAGTQYLQRRSTLVGTPGWINVETNEAPFPPPCENIWLRAASPVSNEFYRVIERNPSP